MMRRWERRAIRAVGCPALLYVAVARLRHGAARFHHDAHAAEVVLDVLAAGQHSDYPVNAELNASVSAFLLPWSPLRLAVRLRCELRQIR
jgi:hypothetical protein